jgi:hypothetical protein
VAIFLHRDDCNASSFGRSNTKDIRHVDLERMLNTRNYEVLVSNLGGDTR